jgi:hypothetical protein
MRDEAKGGKMSHFDDGALHAYLDGELAPVERAQVEAHVAECATCRTRLDEERVLIQRASQLLGFVQPPAPGRAAPPPLHQLRHPRLVWRLRMPLTWAASVVVALGLGYYARDGMLARRAPVPEVAFLDSPDNAAATPQADALSRTAAGPPRLAASPSRAPAPPEPPRASLEKAREPALVVDGNFYGARKDTAGAAAGVAAIPSQAQQPPAAPLMLTEGVVTAAREADVVAARGRQETTSWPVIGRDQARRLLGADPVGVPGFAVREMHGPVGEGVVLVEQQVDSATVIQLFQRRAEPLDVGGKVSIRAGGATPTERLARFVGSLRVEIAGPLTSDSLSKLLEQLQPIP